MMKYMAIKFGMVRHKRLALFFCINARVSMGKKQKLMQTTADGKEAQ